MPAPLPAPSQPPFDSGVDPTCTRTARARLRLAGAIGLIAVSGVALLAGGCSNSDSAAVDVVSPSTYRTYTARPSTTAGRKFLSPDLEDQFARDLAAARGGGGGSASPSGTARSSTSLRPSTSTTVSSGPAPTSSISAAPPTTAGGSPSTTAAGPPPTEAPAPAPSRPGFCDPGLAFEREVRDLLGVINGKPITEAQAKVKEYTDSKGDRLTALPNEAPDPIKSAIQVQVTWLQTLAAGNDVNNREFESAVGSARDWLVPNCGEAI